MSPMSLGSLVDAARRAVRRDVVFAIAALVAAVVPFALVLAWLLAGLPAWGEPGPLPLLLVGGALIAAVALAVGAVRLWLAGIDEGRIAARAEESAGLPEGTLRGVLELGRSLPAGTSEGLYRHTESKVGQSFAGRRPREVSGELGRSARRRLALAVSGLAALCLAVAALALLSPRRTQASWAPLLHPVAHMTPPALPALEVLPGNAAVARGEDLAVRVRAPGRDAVTLVWRSQGAVMERETLPVTTDSAAGSIPRIDAPTTYWIEAPDGARSDRFTVTPVDPLLVSELVVEVVFPPYLQRTPERYDADVPPLMVPAGTRLEVRGRATRPLSEAALTAGGEDALALDVSGDRFSARFQPVTSGLYDWRLRDAGGEPLAAAPPALDITVVVDQAPLVEMTWPTTDTILPADLVQLVAADALDDHGLAAASVVSWKVGRAGAEPRREDPVELDGGEARALLRHVLDARDRGLMPGDTLKVFLRVTDTSPARQTGETRVLSLYLPGMTEMRDRIGDEANSLVDEARAMAQAARDVESATRDLQRQTAATNARRNDRNSGARSGGSPGSMEYQQSEEARAVMEQQQALLDQIQEMRDRLETFERSAERAGLQDAELRREMEELREMYDQLMTPEMRQRMDELKKALETMDADALEKALEELGQQQDQIRKQLEENMDQLRRAASEQQMNALAQDARELATQQEALSQSMREETPTAQQAQQQQDLSQRADQLQQNMEALKQELERQGEAEAGTEAGKAAEQAQQAGQQMQSAAQDAGQQRGEQAASKGDQAADQLQQAASTLDSARDAMANAWKEELQQAVQQAMDEALSLAERQQQLLEQMQQGDQQQGQQGEQGMKPPTPPQSGQQGQQSQTGGQQAGQQQGQQSGQQQGQQSGQGQQGGQQAGQQAGQQQGGQQGGGQQQGGQQGSGTGGGAMQSEQQALQQGLEQLGRNLAEAGDRSSLLDKDVGAALGRANMSMQQTLEAMQQQGRTAEEQASQTVDALNRLAMALLQRSQEIGEQSGSALEQVLQQLAEVAKQQGSLNGESNALMPMNLAPQTRADQANQLAQQQQQIASRLDGLSDQVGRRDDLLGQLDQLAQEAEDIARTLSGGRLPPDVLARQERLFHRLLDAGRTLEKEEFSEERVGELPGEIGSSHAAPLDPALLMSADRYRVPTPDELRALPPAYRRLVVEYFARLNRTDPPGESRERR